MMKARLKGMILALTVSAVMVSSGAVSAQYTHWTPYWDEFQNMKDIVPKGYVCYKVAAPVVVDGNLEEDAWRYIPWTEYFVDIEGDVKPRPWFRTQAKMAWDDAFFYVAADIQERDVWGTLTEHDSIIYRDNDFEIFIDPNSDNHEYYEIEINALNTVWDLMLMTPYRDGGERVDEWSAQGLKTAIFVNGTLNDPSDRDQGWSVEFAIPWSVLREYAHKPAPPAEGDQWRINFSRVEYQCTVAGGEYARAEGHPGENWVWSPPGVINMHCPEKVGLRSVLIGATRHGALHTGTHGAGPNAFTRGVLRSARLPTDA
ncbi:MAG: carbohydrate-binding family 9-like protein [Candidatus Latescibacteria bacterium]|nr:carbohydrate-binding family 9-like protein [Candidatus Latescibacterota bacterium]